METPIGTFTLEESSSYFKRAEWDGQELSLIITVDSQTTQEELDQQISYLEQLRRNFTSKEEAIRNFAAKEFDMEPTEENLSSFEILGITDRGNEYGIKTKEFTSEDSPIYGDLNRRGAIIVDGVLKSTYARILIRKKQ